MATTRSVLGKGLGSLIPQQGAGGNKQNYWGSAMNTVPGHEQIVQVSPEVIDANPWQPRAAFDKDKLDELAASIKEYGIIQPLIVTESGEGRLQLIAGERRLKAARQVGLQKVPVVIRKAEDQLKLELSIIENVQRHDLNPVEEALSYRRLIDEFGLTQEQVGKKVGKSRPSVANFLRLLTLPPQALEALRNGSITFSHAKVLLSYDSPQEQQEALSKILERGMTVSQAATVEQGKRPSTKPARRDPVLVTWEDRLSKKLGFPSRIKKGARGGSIEIQFASDEDLKHILDELLD